MQFTQIRLRQKVFAFLKDRRQLRARWEHIVLCKKCSKTSSINFMRHLSCFQNLILPHCEFCDLATDFFTVCGHKFPRVLCNCRSLIGVPFGNNVNEEESAVNLILITPPKNSVKLSQYNSATFAV